MNAKMIVMLVVSCLLASCAAKKVAPTVYEYAENLPRFTKPAVAKPMVMGTASVGKPVAVIKAILDTTEFYDYTVKSWEKDGDCLWNIALRTTGDSMEWATIFSDNYNAIGANPNLIIEGQTLRLRK